MKPAIDTSSAALEWAPCFIEHQFPVAKVSMESYKERTAKQSQVLTGLGKWWGRKPLVLVRAALLGLLLPVSEDQAKDREIFLKLMTMDQEGLVRRKKNRIPPDLIWDNATASERERYFQTAVKTWRTDAEIAFTVMQPVERDEVFSGEPNLNDPKIKPTASSEETKERKKLIKAVAAEAKKDIEMMTFERLPYSEKLGYCLRPEHLDGPAPDAWSEINAHLGTNAASLPELVEELGKLRFGHRPRVGDSFCGAGSVPFEAARLGCDAYGSDLSPVAALLTWAALNIIGDGQEIGEKVRKAQQKIFDSVDRQVTEWAIEHNEDGWRADAYLYCAEVRDPESGWMIPLAPSWVIGEKTKTVAKLIPNEKEKRFDIKILEGVSSEEIKAAKEGGTVKDSRLVPPNGGQSTPIDAIRRDLRLWESQDLAPREDDVFQERLYCIRWVETYTDENGNERTRRHYRAPTKADLRREMKVLELLAERFSDWQSEGYIPSRGIEQGYNTTQPIRERGWTHWHHLFNPRQLLTNGLLQQTMDSMPLSREGNVVSLLSISRCVDYNSRLCRWHPRTIGDKSEQVFSNQALNTLFNYACRSVISLEETIKINYFPQQKLGRSSCQPLDARQSETFCHLWITDPPYADAINYHELSEFFLAWYEKQLLSLFPEWYTDSKRALAVKGNDEKFRKSMMECYRCLVVCMPENGLQIVMFTHQDASVWADLAMILWAAGLRVTAAWCIATETDSALKQGNYVQGTVLLVLRKRTEEEPVFLDELVPRIEAEVKRQLDSMIALEDKSDPNFGDADYQLAAYAAALRVLTERPIEELDPAKEILRARKPGETNPLEQLIRNAVKIACDHLVPQGIETELWKSFSPMERFYLKGLEVESHAEHRSGVYQELARGFGASDYTDLLENTRANQTRLKTAEELGRRFLSGDGFAKSLVRQVLFSIHQVVRTEEVRDGLNWLRTELPDYWASRQKIICVLDYLAGMGSISATAHWWKDSEAANLLAGAVRNDHV